MILIRFYYKSSYKWPGILIPLCKCAVIVIISISVCLLDKDNKLNAKLAVVDCKIKIDDVQQYWNVFENKIIKIIDEIVPLTEYTGDVIKENTPKIIKNKINRCNRLLKSFIRNPNTKLFYLKLYIYIFFF